MKIRTSLGILLLSVNSARAQTAPQPMSPAQTTQEQPTAQAASPKVDPAKEADIQRLMDMMGTKKMINQMVPAMTTQMKTVFQKNLPSDERSGKILDFAMAKVQARLNSGEYQELFVSIYDKYFTTEDIKDLIQFYDSRVGRKLVAVLPQISQDAMAVSFHWYQEMVPEIQKEIERQFPEIKQAPKPSPNQP